MEHTPGPWHVAPLDGKYYGTRVQLSDGVQIKVWGSRVWKPSARELAKWAGEEDQSEIMSDGHYEDVGDYANACLIAAAPDLLAALQSILGSANADDLTEQQFQSAAAAIAKARGQS